MIVEVHKVSKKSKSKDIRNCDTRVLETDPHLEHLAAALAPSLSEIL